jgi:hypothetical protein
MQTAESGGKLVTAGSESPDVAVCPDCRSIVVKRTRKTQGGGTIYLYRHKRGVGVGCPRRYRQRQEPGTSSGRARSGKGFEE